MLHSLPCIIVGTIVPRHRTLDLLLLKCHHLSSFILYSILLCLHLLHSFNLPCPFSPISPSSYFISPSLLQKCTYSHLITSRLLLLHFYLYHLLHLYVYLYFNFTSLVCRSVLESSLDLVQATIELRTSLTPHRRLLIISYHVLSYFIIAYFISFLLFTITHFTSLLLYCILSICFLSDCPSYYNAHHVIDVILCFYNVPQNLRKI